MPGFATSERFGPAYFCGRARSNYANYEQRQRGMLVWAPLVWLFARITKQYGNAPLTHVDVGCAFGFFVAHARRFVHRSIGVDVSAYAIARARELFPAIEFLEAPAERLPFPDGSVDVATSFDTLEHLTDAGAGVRECSRILQPRGTLLLRVPYDGVWRTFLGWRDKDPTHVSVLSLAGWREVLERAGFSIRWSLTYPTAMGGHFVAIAHKQERRTARAAP